MLGPVVAECLSIQAAEESLLARELVGPTSLADSGRDAIVENIGPLGLPLTLSSRAGWPLTTTGSDADWLRPRNPRPEPRFPLLA